MSSELRPMTPKYKGHILKFVPILRRAPYNLCSAADHLERWIRGTLVDGNPIDVSACVLEAAPAAPALLPATMAAADGAPAPLEPPPGVVGLLTRLPAARGKGFLGFP